MFDRLSNLNSVVSAMLVLPTVAVALTVCATRQAMADISAADPDSAEATPATTQALQALWPG